MTSAGILIGPGRRVFDIAVAREVWADRSELGLPRAEVRLLASRQITELDSAQLLRRTHGIREIDGLDLLVVPGTEDPLAGAQRSEIAAVEAAAAAGIPIASLCTGAFTLGEAGLLDGRTVTTHWRYADELALRFPRATVRPRDLYCGDGAIWTSAGVTAGIDLLLHLVRAEWGAAAAETVARSMVTPVYRPGSQAQFADTATPRRSSASVERLQELVTAALRHTWTVSELAGACALSPRSFHRWFAAQLGTTPVTWVNDLRVREAQRLLEQTDAPISEIAHLVGFSTDDLLRKHFSARLRTTPSRHRADFRTTV